MQHKLWQQEYRDAAMPVRRLSDGEIRKIFLETPEPDSYKVRSFFRYCTVENKATLQADANRYIEDVKLAYDSQRILWAGVELMATFYDTQPRAINDKQLPLL